MSFGMQHRTFFDRAPEWAALQPLPLEERLEALRNETRRAELLAAATANTPPLPFDGVYVLTDDAVDYSKTTCRPAQATLSHPGQNGPGWHIRPGWRRVCPVFSG
jgi:hypothetical protein